MSPTGHPGVVGRFAGAVGERRRSPVIAVASWLVVGALACGKRGDPLPPLRPVPEAATQVSVEQTGDRLRLSWKAPARNHDGTTENLNLSEVRVLRRVLDLEALVKAQTHPATTTTTTTAPAGTTSGTASPTSTAGESPPASGPQTTPPESEGPAATESKAGGGTTASVPGTGPSEAERPPPEAGPVGEPPSPAGQETGPTSEPPEGTGASAVPPAPMVAFPPFEGEAVVVATLPAAEPGATGTYEEDVDPQWIGKRVEYAVVAVNRKKRVSPVSDKVQIDPIEALLPPEAPHADVGDGVISLTWSPPVGEVENQAQARIGYLVFRRPGASPSSASTTREPEYPSTPLDAEPLSATSYEDRDFVFRAPICYAVATVLLPREPQPPASSTASEETETGAAASKASEALPPAESRTPESTATAKSEPEATEPGTESKAPEEAETKPLEDVVPVVPPIARPPRLRSRLSDETCLTPEDRFPPPVPTGLVAVPSAEGNLLTWRAVDGRDLAAYRVYAAASGSGPFELLAEVETTSYTDTDAPRGEARYYRVTAIDNAPAGNESDRSEVASATRPQ